MRAERLLEIVELLRHAKQVKTAAQLAESLGVTTRTLYRDIATLKRMGTPIRGERGVGYVLGDGYDVPPLMFDADQLEALMLGARMVAAQADAATVRAAEAAIEKILAVVPVERRPWLLDSPLFALSFRPSPPDQVDLQALRPAFRAQQKVRLGYRDREGQHTQRTVWPLSLGFIDGRRCVVAWCERRQDFRHFRSDRIEDFEVLGQTYPGARAALLARWREGMRVEMQGREVRGAS